MSTSLSVSSPSLGDAQNDLAQNVALSQPLVCARGLGKRELGRDRNLESRRRYRARETLPLRSTCDAVVRIRPDPAPLLRHGLDAVRIREPPAASESVETRCERLSTCERNNRIDPVGAERPRRTGDVAVPAVDRRIRAQLAREGDAVRTGRA